MIFRANNRHATGHYMPKAHPNELPEKEKRVRKPKEPNWLLGPLQAALLNWGKK